MLSLIFLKLSIVKYSKDNTFPNLYDFFKQYNRFLQQTCTSKPAGKNYNTTLNSAESC